MRPYAMGAIDFFVQIFSENQDLTLRQLANIFIDPEFPNK
jgi:hypothetical protein